MVPYRERIFNRFGALIHFQSAGPPGLEPGTAVLETAVLPLNYRPLEHSLRTFGRTLQSRVLAYNNDNTVKNRGKDAPSALRSGIITSCVLARFYSYLF
jgi:hypothetical protein